MLARELVIRRVCVRQQRALEALELVDQAAGTARFAEPEHSVRCDLEPARDPQPAAFRTPRRLHLKRCYVRACATRFEDAALHQLHERIEQLADQKRERLSRHHAPPPAGGNEKRPRSRRLYHTANPLRSHARTLIRSLRRLRKTKRFPLSGPSPEHLRVIAARPSIERRISAGCAATKIRTSAESVSTRRADAAPSQARARPRQRRAAPPNPTRARSRHCTRAVRAPATTRPCFARRRALQTPRFDPLAAARPDASARPPPRRRASFERNTNSRPTPHAGHTPEPSTHHPPYAPQTPPGTGSRHG